MYVDLGPLILLNNQNFGTIRSENSFNVYPQFQGSFFDAFYNLFLFPNLILLIY